MDVEPGSVDDADEVADLWVSLADEQQRYGSHVDAEHNRAAIRDVASRYAATDRLLVARGDVNEDGNGHEDGIGPRSEAGSEDWSESGSEDRSDERGEDGSADDSVERSSDGEAEEEASGETVGFVTFDLETGRFSTGAVKGVVEHLYVAPEARNRGVGGDLLAAAERGLADRGAEIVVLEALARNEGARRFYRRHGYSVHRVGMEKSLE